MNGNGQKTGSAIVLKVMSGDKVNIQADSWYGEPASSNSQSALGWPDLIASLAGGIAGTGAGSHNGALLQQNQNLKDGLGSFLTNVVNADYVVNGGNKPKVYLNYVLFDDQFNVVITNDGNNSRIDRVGDAGQLKSHIVAGHPITRNGYLYIYVSNETPGLNVIFDNLKVTHTRGALTEETHYYPFGLTMAGISSKAAGKLQNRYRFNGGNELQNNEFSNGSGLDWYDAMFRQYDPQIGRFHQLDPLAEFDISKSAYVFVSNNPISFSDPFGLADSTKAPGFPNSTTGANVLPAIVLAPVVTKVPASDQGYVIDAMLGGQITPLWPNGNSQNNTTEAGVPSLVPVSPGLYPVGPPGRVIPLHPPIVEEAGAGVLAPILVRGVSVIVATVWPIKLGAGASSVPLPYFTKDPYPGHGNNRGNSNEHIIYRFTFNATDGKTPVLKYGISDVYSNGLDRPENQKAALMSAYGSSVNYVIMARGVNRLNALFLEQLLVSKHVQQWGYMPREQVRPGAFNGF
ncbi:RHS repeat-associated core domain-containing protein [Filimonas effusa]|uniref:RHS repeat-associated core domain-containing protein n=1 Tax=Filimonas effusa TaxID=2508721 RepID=A0A4Q1D152_9BACT|nr:RHS repeat-associated core domain-containing protein [Filimonas effusa]RXK81422.1 RHS repeat-associated core domain-containing protein [Filimonas effusa]